MIECESQVAVIIPCLNEEPTVGKVIDDFRRELPDAAIYVVDNGSTDAAAAVAIIHRARVISVRRRGKGSAVRSAFCLMYRRASSASACRPGSTSSTRSTKSRLTGRR
jgi:Glycosyl transferase family 2